MKHMAGRVSCPLPYTLHPVARLSCIGSSRHAARSVATKPQPMHGELRSLIEVAG